jgi:Glycosyl hydrolases family 38 N-terminal domain/Glycosyl hydrolases family 38 C-terminal domain
VTTRLLRESLGSPKYDGMRHTLRSALHTVVYQQRGLTVTGRPLPLLRQAPDGSRRLEQAIRVTADADDGAVLHITTYLDGHECDRVTVEAGSGRATADLFVPEVAEPVTARLVISDAAGELGESGLMVTPQRKWNIYLVHHSHLDIGYTDRQGTVLRGHSEYLDSALELAEATEAWPDDSRFRWTVESALPLRRWLAGRPDGAREHFTRLAREGRIEVTAMPFQLHTEACSTEELHRLLRFTDDLRERYGIPVRSAMHTDVPGAVAGFVDALAASGVRYLSAAHNWAGRSVPWLVGGQELERPFWWRAPSSNRVLVWFTDTPHGMAYMEGNVLGVAEDYAATLDLLPNYLDGLAHRPFPYGGEAFGWSGLDPSQISKSPYRHDVLHLRVQGGPADNAGPSLVPASVARRWNRTWAWPRLRSAVNTDFFTAVERDLGETLAEHTGDWTDWWADGLGSGARPLGYVRRAQNAVRQAESLHALAGDGDVSGKADAVYDRLGLFNEHTWGAANPWLDSEDGFDSGGMQWARKCELAYQAADDALDLLADGARRLGATFAPDAAAETSFLVVNTGPGSRSDVAEFFVSASTIPLGVPFEVFDARTDRRLPHHDEVFEPLDEPTRLSGRRVQVRVDDVAALGWVRLDLRRGGTHPSSERLTGACSIENGFYRVEYDLPDAVISSVFDKDAGCELVNTRSCAGFGQYVYDRYSTVPHVNHLSGHIEAKPGDLSLLASRTLGRRASVIRAERTAVGESLTVEMNGDGADWIRTTVKLYEGVRRVDIVNTLMKRGASAKESVFFAFPFAVPEPSAVWELTGGTGGTTAPVVPGAAAHLLPIRHWVGFGDDDFALAWATLEAPLVMLGDLYLPYAPFPATVTPTTAEPATVYSWALNNIWDTNFPAQQQGETTFRYAFASAHGEDPRALGMRTAASLTDPLVAVPLSGRATTSMAPASGLFAGTDHDLVQVSSLTPARRGHRLAVWLRSVADHDVDVTVHLPWQPDQAHVGTTLERDLRPVRVDGADARVPVPAGAVVALIID